MDDLASTIHNDLSAYWMPFTPNKAFKENPRLIARADGMYYYDIRGRKVLDGTSGLWCCNLGHNHPKIVEAIRDQAGILDYSTAFSFAHPKAFELANRVSRQFPGELDHIFFTNSGSESVDTALKIAIAYHRMRGEASRTRLIGRENGYHGVGFGGISVGGMPNNRKFFGSLLPGVDHMPFPYDPATQSFCRGQPKSGGVQWAEELEKIITLHDASTIAAVIVEPVVGSYGVFVPPRGYLKRLRELTAKHGILLIFDEVITAFGRLGAANACSYFGVEPDLVAMAKGLTSGAVPMGAVAVQKEIYDTFIEKTESGIEFFHGYTYSAHPLATAAALAAQDAYAEEGIAGRVRELSPVFEDAMHSLKGANHVTAVRNLGFMGGISLESRDGAVGARAYDVFQKAWEAGLVLRNNGDTIALAPPLIAEKMHIEQAVEILGNVLMDVA